MGETEWVKSGEAMQPYMYASLSIRPFVDIERDCSGMQELRGLRQFCLNFTLFYTFQVFYND